MTIKVSNSEIQSFKSCRRRWWLTYYRELGLKRTEEAPSGPRQLGTKVHAALQRYYEDGLDLVQTITELYDHDVAWYQEHGTPDQVEGVRKEFDLAHAIVSGYEDWIEETGVDHGLTLIGTEATVEIPMDEFGFAGYALRGKLDARFIRDVDGASLFLDHKTVAEMTTPQKLLPIDEQMKFYHLLDELDRKVNGAQSTRTDGALYNMLRKVKRTARANPPFYLRVEQRHNKLELESMWQRTLKVLEEIRETRARLDAGESHLYVCPPRPSRDCTWQCDFFRVCGMFDDGSNIEDLLAERYDHRDPHERYQDNDSTTDIS